MGNLIDDFEETDENLGVRLPSPSYFLFLLTLSTDRRTGRQCWAPFSGRAKTFTRWRSTKAGGPLAPTSRPRVKGIVICKKAFARTQLAFVLMYTQKTSSNLNNAERRENMQ